MKLRILLALCLLPAFSSLALADTVWDEGGIQGDLSGDFSNPDSISFLLGSNTIIGSIGNNGNTGGSTVPGYEVDADYFTFSIDAGQQLSAINVDSYTFAPTSPGASFLAYVAGTSFPADADSSTFPGNIDGIAFFLAGSGDILPLLSGGGPLGEGDYSIWIQETADTVVDYQLSFQGSSAVPEPTGAFLLALVTIGCASRRKRMAA